MLTSICRWLLSSNQFSSSILICTQRMYAYQTASHCVSIIIYVTGRRPIKISPQHSRDFVTDSA